MGSSSSSSSRSIKQSPVITSQNRPPPVEQSMRDSGTMNKTIAAEKQQELPKTKQPSVEITSEKNRDMPKTTGVEKQPDPTKAKKTGSEAIQNKEINLNTSSDAKGNDEKSSQMKAAEQEDPNQKDQELFMSSLRLSCELANPEAVLAAANKNVWMLDLRRAPTHHLNLSLLLEKLQNLQVLDLSGNQIGPVCFRAIMYAMCQNTTITVLNVGDNQTDTDSALSLGTLLSQNQTLSCLDISGNYLGKDYFSRCVGPAMSQNSGLTILRCRSIGSTDLAVFMDNLQENNTLKELCISHNGITSSSDMCKQITTWFKHDQCSLQTLEMKSCQLQPGDLEILMTAVISNKSLRTIDVSGNKVFSHQSLLDFMLTCLHHGQITEVKMNDMQVVTPGEWKPDDSMKPDGNSMIQSLHLSNCKLKDNHLISLSNHCRAGILCHLQELILTSNPDLTTKGLKAFCTLMKSSDELCALEMLSWGQNQADDLPDLLSTGILPSLHYVNIRKAKINTAKVGAFHSLIEEGGLNTFILDGIKLAGSNAFQTLLGNPTFISAGNYCMSLEALSLAGCQLTDNDLEPLCSAIQQGLALYMLKVSGNRLTDIFIHHLVDSLKVQPGHPLALIDLSNNKVKQAGAIELSDLLRNNKKNVNLRSLNISNNCVEPAGVEALVSVLGCSSLVTLQASDQQANYEEHHLESIYQTLAKALGLHMEKTEDGFKSSCCNFPELPATFHCKLSGLGGYTGQLGRMMDCAAICTDFQTVRKPYLTLHQILELASSLKGKGAAQCLMSAAEWNNVVSADKDAPSWLQLPEHRDRAIYFSGLPASISVQKMDGFLEMEADCEVEDIYFCKDILTQKNNGFAWALLADRKSVDKAVHLYQSGQAVVLGTSFVISDVKVLIDDAASSEAEAKVRQDIKERLQKRLKEDKEHQMLIEQSYYASQKRHAYRLAHPAYADGRIW